MFKDQTRKDKRFIVLVLLIKLLIELFKVINAIIG